MCRDMSTKLYAGIYFSHVNCCTSGDILDFSFPALIDGGQFCIIGEVDSF